MKITTNTKKGQTTINCECEEKEIKNAMIQGLLTILADSETKLQIQMDVGNRDLIDLLPKIPEHSIKKATEPLIAMVEECYRVFPDTTQQDRPYSLFDDIFKIHEAWFKYNYLQPLNRYAFGKRMKKTFPFLEKTRLRHNKKIVPIYRGIEILSPDFRLELDESVAKSKKIYDEIRKRSAEEVGKKFGFQGVVSTSSYDNQQKINPDKKEE